MVVSVFGSVTVIGCHYLPPVLAGVWVNWFVASIYFLGLS